MAALALAVLVGLARAQGPAPTITEQDLDTARRHQPVITDADLERARQQHRVPSEDDLRRAAVPATPRIEALPRPPGAPVDLGALAKGYESAIKDSLTQAALGRGPGMLIFVSLSMPEPTLKRLVDQASRVRATLVLRGLLNGSLKDTVARVQTLLAGRRVPFQIDPTAFDRFSVTAAPTFVLVRDGARPADCAAGTCFGDDAYVSIAGDVSLDYALEHLQRVAPAFDRDADVFLRRLRPDRTGTAR